MFHWRAFELGAASLDTVAQSDSHCALRLGLVAIGLGGDHGCSFTLMDRFGDIVAAIALAGQEEAGSWQVIIEQRIEAFNV